MSQGLDQCLRRMLAKSPGDRFISHEELYKALKQVAAPEDSQGLWDDVDEEVLADVRRPRFRLVHAKRAGVLVAVVAGVAVSGGLAANLLQSEGEPAAPSAKPAQQAEQTGPKIVESQSGSDIPTYKSDDVFMLDD